MENQFLKATTTTNTVTENGALSHSTSGLSDGGIILDYFSKSATYVDREAESVFADISKIIASDKLLALKVIFYNRMITRKIKSLSNETELVQKGQGLKSEFRKAVIYLINNNPDLIYKNLWLIPMIGSWKDLFHKDLVKHLDVNKVVELIKQGLSSEYHRGLIAKYLPRIKSNGNIKNDEQLALNNFAKKICKKLHWGYTDYRKFKSSPENTAHLWQRLACANRWDEIEFGKISGKALSTLVNNKGKDKLTTLERHGLVDKYTNWILNQPTAKFNGYVYELLKQTENNNLKIHEKLTIDKQFDNLINVAKTDNGGIKGNVWCALDTSGSMGSIVTKNISAYDICVSLGIYFSTLNEGAFKDNVIMFDNTSRVLQLKGSFTDKVRQIRNTSTAWGGTNFQSVIDEIVRVRTNNPNIPVEDFPQTLLVVSDMQFNPVGGNTQTNYESAMKKLKSVGLPEITIVWWYVTGRSKDFPNKMDDKGVIMIGGFDGAIISNLLGGETEKIDEVTKEVRKLTPYENMLKALDQEILNLISV